MNAFIQEFAVAARQSPRLFFAPIVGAVDAVRRQLARMSSSTESCDSSHRREPQKQPGAE